MEASNINGDELVSVFDKKCSMSVKEAPTSGPHSITICKSESGFLSYLVFGNLFILLRVWF